MKKLRNIGLIALIGLLAACGACGCKPLPNVLSVSTVAKGHNFSVKDDFNVYKPGDSVLITFETSVIDNGRSVKLVYPVSVLKDTTYYIAGMPHGQSVAIVTKVTDPNKKQKR